MISFKKMHGNGNDFIIIENLTKAHSMSKSQLIKMGDRKKGLGFDQLITINPPKDSNQDFYIKFFNSDGSEAKFLERCNIKKYKFINAGNQHLIIETKKVISFDLDDLSSRVRKRKFFKNVNISLFTKLPKHLELRTNEAGAGETLSCGSASAATASFNINDKSSIKIISAGGELSLRRINDKLEMIGPAEFICEGIWLKN